MIFQNLSLLDKSFNLIIKSRKTSFSCIFAKSFALPFISAPEDEREYRLPKQFDISSEITDRLKALNELEEAEMNLSQVYPLIEKWGEQHQKQALKLESDILQAMYQRLEVMLIKLACIFQLSHGQTTTVLPESFNEAVKVIDFLTGV